MFRLKMNFMCNNRYVFKNCSKFGEKQIKKKEKEKLATKRFWWQELRHGNMTKLCITLFLASCRCLQKQQCIWSTKWSLLSLILMQGSSFLLAGMLPELVQTSGGLQMEETKSSCPAGLACRPKEECTLWGSWCVSHCSTASSDGEVWNLKQVGIQCWLMTCSENTY